ncbi:LysR family transcriptional regulator [Frankia sp. Cppng1_Ct_nod]|uniref:LysR family transcriptional regulator n=1 Tax=Frankia sp. Cppng1_Ct_nod TaxID=2897162 RepID=UPI0010415CBA
MQGIQLAAPVVPRTQTLLQRHRRRARRPGHDHHRASATLRHPGVTSRPELLHTLGSDIPADVRRAVEGGLAGWHRLHRFQMAMTFPTINTAADHLGADQAALVRQFRRLERDIGAPLFYRATHAQPMRPTPRGQALLRALTRPEIRAHMTNAKKK